MANNEVRIRLAVDGGAQVKDALSNTDEQLQRLNTNLVKTAHYGAGLLVLVPTLHQMAAGFVTAADAVTTLRSRLVLATGSTEKASAAFESLFLIAQNSRTSFTELGATFATIARAGQALGLSQERLLVVTAAIGNAMTISGGSAQSMQAALVQLGQGLASGTLRGEELNSVMEQAPRLAKALADGMGVPIGQLRKLGEQGEITSQMVIAALEKSAPQLAKELSSATMTVGQSFTMLSNSATKFVGEADAATGASGTLAGALKGIAGALDSVGETIRKHDTTFAIIGGTLAGAASVAGVIALGKGLVLLAGGIGAVGLAVAALNPVTLAILGVGVVTGGVMAASSAYDKTASGIKRLITQLEDADTELLRLRAALVANPGNIILGGQVRDLERDTVKRTDAVRALRQQLALLSAPTAGSVAEDARLDRGTQSFVVRTQRATALTEVMSKLSGVNAEFGKNLNVLHASYAAGETTLKAYREQVAALIDKEGGGKEMLAKTAASRAKASIAADAFATDAMREYAKGIDDLGKLTAAATAQDLDLSKAQAKLREIQADPTWGAFNRQQKEQIIFGASLAQVAEDRLAEDKKAIESQAALTKSFKDAYDADVQHAKQSAESVAKRVLDLQDEQAATTLAAVGNGSLAQAIEIVTIKRLDEMRVQALQAGNNDAAAAIQREIDKRRELVGLIAGKEARQAAADTAKDAAKAAADTAKAADDEWKKTADSINQGLTDALFRAFESGKGFGRTLRDSLVNTFKTMVVRPIISAIVSPLAGAALGALGFSGAAGAAGAAGASGSVAGSLAGSAASSLLSGSAFGASIFGSSAAYGAAIGTTNFAAGSQAAMLAAQTGQFGLAGAAATSSAAAGAGAGAASAAMAAIPYVAIALVIANAMGFFRSEKKTDGGLVGTLGAGDISDANVIRTGGTLFRGPDYETQVTGVSASSRLLQDAFNGLRSNTVAQAAALGLSTDNLRTFTTAVGSDILNNDASTRGLSLKGLSAEQAQKKIAEALQSANEQLAALALAGSKLGRNGETTVQTLARLSGSLATVNGVLGLLGGKLYATSLAGGDLASKLVDLFGSLDAFKSTTGAYFEAYFSDAERTAALTGQVSAALRALGFAMPATRAGFRQLVQAQDLATDAGRRTYAALVQLSGAFAALVDDSAEAQKAAEKAAAAFSALSNAGEGIAAFITELRGAMGGSAGGLDAARAAYAADLAGAQGGDAAASGRVVASAKALVEAVRNNATDPLDLARQTSAIAVQLQTLPAVVSWQVTMLDKLDQLGSNTAAAGPLAAAMASARATLTIAMDSDIPADVRRLVLARTGSYAVTVGAIMAAGIPDNLRALLLNAETVGLRAVALEATFGAVLTAEQRAALLATDATVQRTIRAGIETGTLSADQSLLLGLATGTVSRTIQTLVDNTALSASDRRLLETVTGAAAGSLTLSGTVAVVAPGLTDAVAGLASATNDLKGMISGTPSAPDETAKYGWVSETYREGDSDEMIRWPRGLIPEKANGGAHAGGLRIVGEKGPELEATGASRIWTARQTADMVAGAGSNTATVAELQALRAELRAGQEAIAAATQAMAKQLARWDDGGALLTKVAV